MSRPQRDVASVSGSSVLSALNLQRATSAWFFTPEWLASWPQRLCPCVQNYCGARGIYCTVHCPCLCSVSGLLCWLLWLPLVSRRCECFVTSFFLFVCFLSFSERFFSEFIFPLHMISLNFTFGLRFFIHGDKIKKKRQPGVILETWVSRIWNQAGGKKYLCELILTVLLCTEGTAMIFTLAFIKPYDEQ